MGTQNTSGDLTFAYQSNNGWVFELDFTNTFRANEWYHVAVSRDGSNDIRGFVNGTQVGTTQNNSTSMVTTEGLWVGGGYNSTARILDGYMDEIRISNTARYTANFTPDTTEFSSDANTMLLIHSNTTMGSTTFTDSGPNTHTVTPNGDVMHVAPKIGTGMAAFDGSGDYLSEASVRV